MITVVAMVHQRHDGRIERFIRSLERQSSPPFEVIVIDTSPSEVDQMASKQMCRAVTHVSAPGAKIEKSRALNIGLRKVKSQYTMFTDIDILFHPEFLSKLGEMFKMVPEAFVQAVAGYLPPACATENWEEMATLVKSYGHEVSHRFSPGACQAARTQVFLDIHGFDERYAQLGGMDDDLMVRVRKFGLQNHWIDEMLLVHQWHDKSAAAGLDSHLFTPETPIVANGEEWGKW